MSDYADAGHRPHGVHKGQDPKTYISYGPKNINVTLNTWGPQENLNSTLYNQLQSNWGDQPSHVESDSDLSPRQSAYVESCFNGKTLQQCLELITFAFTIDGVSRACTHQLVRTRIGASVMQHGGRDNDWRHRRWTLPETIRRACVLGYPDSIDPSPEEKPYHCCVDDMEPIGNYIAKSGSLTLMQSIENYLKQGKELYSALVDSGIPWQDARRLLPIGTQTYIHISYTYPSLRGVLANRLEHVMDWEINCVAQLMLREIKMKCPPLLSKYLGSHSDRAKRSIFSKLESWPPDLKWPDKDGITLKPSTDPIKRTHKRLQNPFFILHPDSMEGDSIRWVKTNGFYPKELRPKI